MNEFESKNPEQSGERLAIIDSILHKTVEVLFAGNNTATFRSDEVYDEPEDEVDQLRQKYLRDIAEQVAHKVEAETQLRWLANYYKHQGILPDMHEGPRMESFSYSETTNTVANSHVRQIELAYTAIKLEDQSIVEAYSIRMNDDILVHRYNFGYNLDGNVEPRYAVQPVDDELLDKITAEDAKENGILFETVLPLLVGQHDDAETNDILQDYKEYALPSPEQTALIEEIRQRAHMAHEALEMSKLFSNDTVDLSNLQELRTILDSVVVD